MPSARRARDDDVAAELTWPRVLAWRAGRQHLARRVPAAAALGVVSDIAGLHAQVMSSAELTLWARVEGLDARAVQDALWRDRTLVKTWALRGTLHLLPAAELPLWVAAQGRLRPRHHHPAWLRHHGLTRAQADAMLAAIPEALAGEPFTREELATEVAAGTGFAGLAAKLGGGFGDLLKPAAFAGHLVFAPNEGRNVRFTRPDRWLGGWENAEPETAGREVARRYLGAYGPATRGWFARWFGMTSAPAAERWLRELGEEIVPVHVEGTRAWMLNEHVEAAARAEPAGVVRLVPAFDHYVVAAPRDVEAVLPATARRRVYRPQGWLSPVLLLDGVMAGVWTHESAAGRVRVEVTPFGRLGAAVRAGARDEAERLAGHLGGELELTFAPPAT